MKYLSTRDNSLNQSFNDIPKVKNNVTSIISNYISMIRNLLNEIKLRYFFQFNPYMWIKTIIINYFGQ